VHRYRFQFGIATLMWWVAFAALNCWLFSLGPWGAIVALVTDKHVLVAYLCWLAQVDRRSRRSDGRIARKAA
jgi:hypothetical protein